MNDNLLTVEEAATYLHVPKSWIYKRTRIRGRSALPCFKVGKYVRFRAADLTDFLERLRRG
jgi:excisionase family DNA binding protein